MPVASRSVVFRLAALSLAMVVAGCAATYRVHGFAPPESDTALLTPGVDDRSAVLAALGPPSTTGAIGDGGGWYYVQSKMEHFAFYAPEEVERTVVAVNFDEAGLLSGVRRFGMEDGRVIDLETGITPTYGRELTIIQQMFGNFGQINPAQLLGQN